MCTPHKQTHIFTVDFLGGISTIPVVKAFSFFAGVAVLINFLLQVHINNAIFVFDTSHYCR